MAEGSDSTGKEAEGIPISGLTAELLTSQSKSGCESLLEFKDLDSPSKGKNKMVLICEHCKCKVMLPGYGTLVEKKIFMPNMTEKYNIGTEPAGDHLTQFWLVEDMFHFENVGFSKNVNATEKYLICADCEIGPIGWHNIQNTREYFVAAERVKYGMS